VPVEQQAPACAGPAQGGDELRATGEVQPLGHERRPRHRRRVGLEQVDLGAVGQQALGEILLERRLLAWRVADLAGGGVEPDQCGGELHQLIPAVCDGVADAAFEV
jgi:hypothetical protein